MIRLANVLKTSWRCPEDVLKTLWRCLEDVLKTFWRCLGKTSWRRIGKTSILVLIKTFWRRLEDVFWRRMSKGNIFVLMKASSRRLHQDECLLGNLFFVIDLIVCALHVIETQSAHKLYLWNFWIKFLKLKVSIEIFWHP